MGRISGEAVQYRMSACPGHGRAGFVKPQQKPASGFGLRWGPGRLRGAAGRAAPRISRRRGKGGGWRSNPVRAFAPCPRQSPPPRRHIARHWPLRAARPSHRENCRKSLLLVCRQVPPNHWPESHHHAGYRAANAARNWPGRVRPLPMPMPWPARRWPHHPPPLQHRFHAPDHKPSRHPTPHRTKQYRWTSV